MLTRRAAILALLAAPMAPLAAQPLWAGPDVFARMNGAIDCWGQAIHHITLLPEDLAQVGIKAWRGVPLVPGPRRGVWLAPAANDSLLDWLHVSTDYGWRPLHTGRL